MEVLDTHQLTGELSLDSLDLAQLVVAIEKELDVDPFRDGSASARTVADLVAIYEQALA
jgi:acyl carrier protein